MKKIFYLLVLFLLLCGTVTVAAAQGYEKEVQAAEALPYEGWLICVGIGIAVGLIAVLIMKGQLKSIRPQRSAGSYVVEGSFHLTGSRELFLYRTVTKREIQNDRSGGRS